MDFVQIKEQTATIDGVELRLLVGHIERLNEIRFALELDLGTLHTHSMAEVFACMCDGTRIIVDDAGFVSLRKGDIVIVPPGVYHSLERPSTQARMSVFSFALVGSPIDNAHPLTRLCKAYESKAICIYRNQENACLLAERIKSTLMSGEVVLPVLLLAELGIRLTKENCERVGTFGGSDAPKKGHDMQRLLLLDHILENQHINKLKIEEIAARLHVSARQFNRIVHMRYGKTWHQVLMQRRVKTAERLLVSTDMMVDAVRVRVGFSSAASFYKEFSRVYGMTPAQYRKRRKSQ